MSLNSNRVIDLSKINKANINLVGKKVLEIGMLFNLGIPITGGFVILPFSELSDSLIKKIRNKYERLSMLGDASVNIFSSLASNKSIIFSNVKGDANVILKIKAIIKLLPEEQYEIVIQKNIKSKIKGKTSTNNSMPDERLNNIQKNRLIDYCARIQKHFYFPQEVEYAVSKGKIFITNLSPFTGVPEQFSKPVIKNIKTQKPLIKGRSINPGIVTGKVKILQNNFNNFNNFKVEKGEIIVIPNLDRLMFKKIKNAKAVIFDSILPNSLEKVLYRKYFQIPTIENVKNAAKVFQNGNIITVNGTNGEIYRGGLIY